MMLLTAVLTVWLCPAAELKIATLHPLLTEMAKELGGDAAEVVPLMPENGALHAFEPGAQQMAAAAGCKLVLACGKGVEPYLDDLREAMGGVRVLPVGDSLPDVYLPGTRVADPHWWNTPANMKRASLVLLEAMQKAAPEHAASFAANRQRYAAQMDKLDRRARLTLQSIPPARRVLVTEHAALCHFCAAYGFTPLAICGVAHEDMGNTAHLAEILTTLRKKNVPCLFAAAFGGHRLVQNLAEQTGAKVGELILDGYAKDYSTYSAVFLFNLNNIAEGLR